MPDIIVLKDGRQVGRVSLRSVELSVGRDAACGLVLADERASRRHGRIVPTATGFAFEDEGSTHGSFVGGARVTRVDLKDGVRVVIGSHELAFASSADAVTTKPAPAVPVEALDFKTVLMSAGAGVDGEGERRLRALFEMSLALDTAEDFNKQLELLIDKAISIMGAERGLLMLRDEATGLLRTHVAREAGAPSPQLEQESVSKSLMERVVREAKGILAANAMSADWGTQSMIANHIHSALCVPLKTGGEVTGVLYVDHRTRGYAFTENDLSFFTVFALQAKSAIDSSRAYWRLIDSLFRASDDIVMICDSEGRITQANRGAGTLLGVAEGGLAGRSIPDLVDAEDREAASKLVAAARSTVVVSGQELRFMGPHKARVPVSASTFQLRDRSGKGSGFCLIGRDQTRVRSLIDELSSANAKLKELNDMKSQFVGMITHELKSPLSVVVGYTKFIIDDHREPPVSRHKDFLEKILKAGDRLIALILEILEITKIETGKMALQIEEVDLAKLMNECVEGLSMQILEKKVTVKLELEPMPSIRADARLLRRLFDNLLSNAVKYNADGGAVTVTSRREGDLAHIFVADTGLGMTPEDKGRLFERFFRSDKVVDIAGTGLGLSTVKAIAERHKGSVAVDTELNRGTTFKVTIPISGRDLE